MRFPDKQGYRIKIFETKYIAIMKLYSCLVSVIVNSDIDTIVLLRSESDLSKCVSWSARQQRKNSTGSIGDFVHSTDRSDILDSSTLKN